VRGPEGINTYRPITASKKSNVKIENFDELDNMKTKEYYP
jgi:hypothetical protein